MPESLEIWTIGHSTRCIEEFLGLLLDQQIQLLADVRHFPGSRRYPQFGREELPSSLARAGIEYRHFLELGGRRKPRPDSPNTTWRSEAFRAYADYMETEEFREGITRLQETAARQRTCLMCAEAVWWRCHRGLISDYLKVRGWRVLHILGPHKIQEHPYTSAARVLNGVLSYRAAETQPELLELVPGNSK